MGDLICCCNSHSLSRRLDSRGLFQSASLWLCDQDVGNYGYPACSTLQTIQQLKVGNLGEIFRKGFGYLKNAQSNKVHRMGHVTLFQEKGKEAKCLWVDLSGKPTGPLFKYNCLNLDRSYQQISCISKQMHQFRNTTVSSIGSIFYYFRAISVFDDSELQLAEVFVSTKPVYQFLKVLCFQC